MKNLSIAILLVTGFAMVQTPVLAREQSFDCAIRYVRVNAERLFVRCHSEWRGLDIPLYVKDIEYYSAPYSQTNARYIFELALEARRLRVPLRMIFEEDPASNPPGCARNNCRRIIAVGMGED